MIVSLLLISLCINTFVFAQDEKKFAYSMDAVYKDFIEQPEILLEAVMAGNIDVVKEILICTDFNKEIIEAAINASIENFNTYKWNFSIFKLLAEKNHSRQAAFTLKKKIEKTFAVCEEYKGMGGLHIAVIQDDYDVAKFLVQYLNDNEKNQVNFNNGMTPLMIASETGNIQMVNILSGHLNYRQLTFKNIKDDNKTALDYAYSNNSPDHKGIAHIIENAIDKSESKNSDCSISNVGSGEDIVFEFLFSFF